MCIYFFLFPYYFAAYNCMTDNLKSLSVQENFTVILPLCSLFDCNRSGQILITFSSSHIHSKPIYKISEAEIYFPVWFVLTVFSVSKVLCLNSILVIVITFIQFFGCRNYSSYADNNLTMSSVLISLEIRFFVLLIGYLLNVHTISN